MLDVQAASTATGPNQAVKYLRLEDELEDFQPEYVETRTARTALSWLTKPWPGVDKTLLAPNPKHTKWARALRTEVRNI